MKTYSIGKILREPLLHFLLLGAALFFIYYEVADPQGEDNNVITVRVSDIERLQAAWERRWGRPAQQQELDVLIDSFVREEVLNREARALGLESGDGIIRRRLAQKMEFLFSDLSDQVAVTEQDLQSYLEENPDRFRIPGTTTFSHVYFSPDRRGDSAETDAQILLTELHEGDSGVAVSSRGDPFMYEQRFVNYSQAEVARLFGTVFSSSLFGQEVSAWSGPIDSGFGVHLVFVENYSLPRVPSLEEVRKEVGYELKAERQKEADAAFYSNLRQRYQVEIEKLTPADEAVAL
jgi:peptidyl-prolyl cis-trans isomerase C